MARIVNRGRGNWRNVTTQRIAGTTDVIAGAIASATPTGTVVRLSAAATATIAAVVAHHVDDMAARGAIADEIIRAASVWAGNRGSRRVWDIDIAAAIGFPWTPDGATAFRNATPGVRVPAVEWPSRVSETPDAATPRGPVVDPATGRDVAPDAA